MVRIAKTRMVSGNERISMNERELCEPSRIEVNSGRLACRRAVRCGRGGGGVLRSVPVEDARMRDG